MLEDIEIPTIKDVHVLAIKEWDENFTGQQWNVCLYNDRTDIISTVLVLSRGRSENKKTSSLRHGLGDLPPKSTAKIEFIPTEVLGFTNEYLVTFFAENKLFERKFVFKPNSISEKNAMEIPFLDREGVMAK